MPHAPARAGTRRGAPIVAGMDSALREGDSAPRHDDPALRQQVLVLYLATSSLDSDTLGWSLFDGAGAAAAEAGDEDAPPYATGLAALRDGWRLIQASPLLAPSAGGEYATSFLKFEFFFERLVPLGAR